MALPDELRYQILKELEKDSSISQRELASLVGISLGNVNYCLQALIRSGWLKAGNFARSDHKLKYSYVLTPKGLIEKTAVTIRFLKYKQEQFELLEKEINELKKEARGDEV